MTNASTTFDQSHIDHNDIEDGSSFSDSDEGVGEAAVDLDSFNSNEQPGPPPTSDPNSWPLSTVLKWLKTIPPLRTTQTVSLCVSHRITGEDLLNFSDERLCDMLGIVFGPHKRVLSRELSKLREIADDVCESISPTERVARVRKFDRESAKKGGSKQQREDDDLSIASGLVEDDAKVSPASERAVRTPAGGG